MVAVGEDGTWQGARIKWVKLNPAWRLSGASVDSLVSPMTLRKGPLPIPESFSPLVDCLREMRDNNIARPFWWPVHAALVTRNPSIYAEVDVGDFKNAEIAGIVTLGGESERDWIALAVDQICR